MSLTGAAGGLPKKARAEISPILLRARPKEKIKLKVVFIDRGLAVIHGPDGMKALVPEQELCILAERLNIEYEGYEC